MTSKYEGSISGQTLQARIYLLGGFEIRTGDRVLTAEAWPRKKAAALMKRLAFDQRLVKDQAMDFLWPEADFSSTFNNLYNTIHTLRKTLETGLGQGAAEGIFQFEDGVLSLTPSVWVDVRAFEQLSSTHLVELPEQRMANLKQALELYRGEMLPDDRYEAWTELPRQALHQRQREVRLALADMYRDIHNYKHAIQLVTPLLAQDIADEPAYRALMHLYTLTGQRHEAIRQYQACVDALATEMDVAPAPETTDLYAKILSGALSPSSAPAYALWAPPLPIGLEVKQNAPLVGRAVEVERLHALLRFDQDHPRRTIFLAGDSGVGKTRLAFEALRTAAAAGMITLLGAAYEQEGQLAYQPFIEAIDRYLADQQRPQGENPISGFQSRGTGDPQQEQWALFNATATFLTGLASTLPVVLLVDDLHAADEASLRLFHYLARQTRSNQVILLATYRSDMGASTGTPFNALLNALYREQISETITLTSLEAEDSFTLMARILKGPAAPELGNLVFENTLGNPFYIEEMTRDLLKSGQVENDAGVWRLRPGEALRVPADLAELLRERVKRLGSPVASLLTAAAVVGREFRFDVLRSFDEMDDRMILDALDTALAGLLLEETPDGYRFRHPLIRQALYAGLSRARRAQYHRQAAAAIETVFAGQPMGLDPFVEDLAYHYDRSDRREQAFAYLMRAGDKAASVYAFEVGVRYLEQALDLMNTLNLADPASRWVILESLGWWQIILANTPDGVARFEQALALPPNEEWQPSGADRARLHRGAAVALITVGDTALAKTHLSEAIAEVDEKENAADYAQVLYNIAQLHWHQNEYEEAFRVAQRSLEIAERANDPQAVARAFEMLALACHSLGEWQNGIEYEQQRITLSGPGLDVTEAFDVHL